MHKDQTGAVMHGRRRGDVHGGEAGLLAAVGEQDGEHAPFQGCLNVLGVDVVCQIQHPAVGGGALPPVGGAGVESGDGEVAAAQLEANVLAREAAAQGASRHDPLGRAPDVHLGLSGRRVRSVALEAVGGGRGQAHARREEQAQRRGTGGAAAHQHRRLGRAIAPVIVEQPGKGCGKRGGEEESHCKVCSRGLWRLACVKGS